MKIVKLPKKEFKEKHQQGKDWSTRGLIVKGEEGPQVVVPEGASTATILHEIYHAKESPRVSKRAATLDEWTLEELEAEEFSKKKRGDEGGLQWMNVANLGRRLIGEGSTPSQAMGNILRSLEAMEYKPGRKFRSWLWEELRHYEEDK